MKNRRIIRSIIKRKRKSRVVKILIQWIRNSQSQMVHAKHTYNWILYTVRLYKYIYESVTAPCTHTASARLGEKSIVLYRIIFSQNLHEFIWSENTKKFNLLCWSLQDICLSSYSFFVNRKLMLFKFSIFIGLLSPHSIFHAYKKRQNGDDLE